MATIYQEKKTLHRKLKIEYHTKKYLKISRGVIRSRKSKKDIQYNGQIKKGKGKNNDLQNTTQKTKE
jgi:hypothetical protein